MRLNRFENTKRNIIVGEIDKVSGILLPFVVRTMIIHMIGAQYLGLTGLFYSIVQMLNLTEMGFGTAIVYSMYKPIADNDERTIQALLAFYTKVYRIVGILVVIVGLLVLPFLPRLIKGEVPTDINIYYLYLIYLWNASIGFFVYPSRKALLIAYQREDISGWVHIFTQFLMYALQAIAIYFTRDYYLYAVMMPITSLLYSFLCAKRVKSFYPAYAEKGDLDKEQYQEIKKQVLGLTIRKVAMLTRNAFDSMFISAFLGLYVTAVYANYYYIMDGIVMLLAVVKTSMAAGVGNSVAMDSISKNLKDMQRIQFLFMWISGWCSVCLLCLYQPFMEIWMGTEMMLSFDLVILFAAYFYLLKMSDIRTLYSEAAGIWWQARYISVAEAVANLVLNWILVQKLQLFGILLATMISYLLFNFIGGAIILFRNYFVEGGFWKYIVSNVGYAVVTAMIAILTYMLVSQIELVGVLGFLIKLVICMVFPNILFLLFYCKTRDFRESMMWVKGKINI